MASPAFDEQLGTQRLVSDAAPSHYIMKIQSYSQLSKTSSIDKYESGVFTAGGYKWKLVVYPNGNKNVKEHVSVYLSMVETTSLPPGWEVHVVFRLFLLDQNNDNYLIIQDAVGKQRRFHGMKLEWGFDQFIPLKTFTDSQNGYLVDDGCAFGAEVFITKERSNGKGESLTMIKDALSHKQAWRIDNFSKLDKEYIDSTVFITGNRKWNMRMYPNGKGSGLGGFISLYLDLADEAESIPAGTKVFAEYTLRIIDQLQGRNYSGKGNHWFSASTPESGWARFISLPNFRSVGTLIKDVCIVEVEVTIHGMVYIYTKSVYK